MKMFENVSILGDSISKGVILDSISKKYKILKESAADLFSRVNNVDIKNYSKFGATTEKALLMTEDILKDKNQSGLILLELGGNDCDLKWDEIAMNPDAKHLPNVSLEKFRENILLIIERIKKSGRMLAIVTLPPIDSEKYFNWVSKGDAGRASNILKYLGDVNYIYRHQERYATTLDNIASEFGIFKIPVRDNLLAVQKYSDCICEDGIHLNEKGQDIMSSVFTDTYNKYIDKKV